MTSWATLPALRLALALAGGIALGSLAGGPLALGLGSAAGVLAVIGAIIPLSLRYRPIGRGLAVWLGAIGVGAVAGVRSAPTPTALDPGDYDYYLARVEAAELEAEWAKVDVTLVQVRDTAGGWSPGGVRARLMLAPEVERRGLGTGALLVGRAPLRVLAGRRNPGGFDYRAYLRQRGIDWQAFVRPGGVQLLRPAAAPGPMERIRTALSTRLASGTTDSAALGVARALVLGERSGIDDDTRAAYARTGAVHVLAVSGLHVGIIAAILLWLLGPLRRRGTSGRVVALVLLWLGLGAYALLTGNAPSVRRSALMFGLLFAGTTLREDGNGLNSLGASAAVLLLLDPQLLFSLGFQLSYCAVGGILAFYPPLKAWLPRANRLGARVGDLVAVSIAATLATAPLTIYTFHQFPWAFALSGLVAVPLVSLALPLLLAGLAIAVTLAPLGYTGAWAMAPGYALIEWCNAFLSALADLPGVLAVGLYPTATTVALALGAVVLLGAACVRRQPRLSLAAAALACAAGLSVADTASRRRQLAGVSVYGFRHTAAVDLFADGAFWPVDEPFCGSGPNASENGEREAVLDRARASRSLRFADAGPGAYASVRCVGPVAGAYAAGGFRWLVLDGEVQRLAAGGPGVDWIVVGNPDQMTPSELAAAFPQTQILLLDYPAPWGEGDWAALRPQPWVLPSEGVYERLLVDGQPVAPPGPSD